MIVKTAAAVALAVSAFGLVGAAAAYAAPEPPNPDPSATAKPATPADATAVRCGVTGANKDLGPYKHFKVDGAKIRTGPSTRCTPVGEGFRTQLADYYCYTGGEGGTWTYLRDVSTGKKGWVRDDLLEGNGSYVHC